MQREQVKKFFWGLSKLVCSVKNFLHSLARSKTTLFYVYTNGAFYARFRLYAAIRREECKMCSEKTIKIYQAPHEERAIKIIFLDTTLFHQHLKSSNGISHTLL